jgi:hypothetical protein
VATELGDIKILIDVDVTRFEASLNNAMSRATSSFNRMGAGMASSVNAALNNAFQQQYQAIGLGVRNAFSAAFAAANQQQQQQMAQIRQNMRQATGGSGGMNNMTQAGQSAGSSFAIGFKSPILNAIGAIHSAIYGLKDIGQMVGTITGFNMAANLSTTESQMGALLRSPRQGSLMAGQLQQLAMETPFSMEDFTGIGRKMLAMGTPSSQLVSQLTTLSDAVAATGGGVSELSDLSEFVAKLRMNPRAMDTDTLLGLVRSGMPLRQTAEHMAGRKFQDEQQATMFLQSRLSGRGAKGVAELLNAIDEFAGGSAKALGRTSLTSVSQRLSEGGQSMLMGTSKGGLNVALGGLNMLADFMTMMGKLNTTLFGLPGLALIVVGFNYLRNALTTANTTLSQFIGSLNLFSQTAQAATAASTARAYAPGAQVMGMMPFGPMSPSFMQTHTMNMAGQWVQNPMLGPLAPPQTAMQKVRSAVQSRMTAMNAGINNFLSSSPNMAGNLLAGSLALTGMFASQSLATQQTANIGNQKAMAENTRLQNSLAGATGGAMLGNMIGTLFPGIGNIVGTVVGSLIGGAAGYLTSEDPNKLPTKAIDENTKALNNATVAMTLLASSIIGGGPRAAGAVSAIELEMYMASRNNMMNVGIG